MKTTARGGDVERAQQFCARECTKGWDKFEEEHERQLESFGLLAQDPEAADLLDAIGPQELLGGPSLTSSSSLNDRGLMEKCVLMHQRVLRNVDGETWRYECPEVRHAAGHDAPGNANARWERPSKVGPGRLAWDLLRRTADVVAVEVKLAKVEVERLEGLATSASDDSSLQWGKKLLENREKQLGRLNQIAVRRAAAQEIPTLTRLDVPRARFDATPWVLGLPGGEVVDLRGGEGDLPEPAVRSMVPEDYVTRLTKVALQPRRATWWQQFRQAQCPGWFEGGHEGAERRAILWGKEMPCVHKFLADVFQGDWETAEALLAHSAAMLFGGNHAQSFTFLIGESGSGKSTWLEILRVTLGDYAEKFEIHDLLTQRGKSNSDSRLLPRLQGPRVVISAEPPREVAFDSAILTSITGESAVTARRLYSEQADTRIDASIAMSAVEMPSLLGADGKDVGLVRRAKVFPFSPPGGSFAPEVGGGGRLLEYAKKVEQGGELPLLLALLVELAGVHIRLFEGRLAVDCDHMEPSGLPETDAMHDALRARLKQDRAFVEWLWSVLEPAPGDRSARVPVSDLYRLWCQHRKEPVPDERFNGAREPGYRQFSAQLRAALEGATIGDVTGSMSGGVTERLFRGAEVNRARANGQDAANAVLFVRRRRLA